MEKNGKIVQQRILIAQKKRPDALNATQKTSALSKVSFLKKSRKTLKKCCFWPKLQKRPIFLYFFQDRTLQRPEVFCVAFSASGRFFWAIKIHYRTIFPFFYPQGGPLLFRGGQNVTSPLKMVETEKIKLFWNQHDQWNNLGACPLLQHEHFLINITLVSSM